MPPANPLLLLAELGQSVWYDYITRDLLSSGELKRLIEDDGLRGMTSNPTIFEKAIAGSQLYDEDIRRMSEAGLSAAEIFESLAVRDVQAACDAFRPLYQETRGRDGFVSLEVSPQLAHDTDGDQEGCRATVARGVTTQRDDQDSGDSGRPGGDHGLDCRRNQRERDPAVLAAAVRRGDRGLFSRDSSAGWSAACRSAGSRPWPASSSVGLMVKSTRC